MGNGRSTQCENLVSVNLGSRIGSHGCIISIGSPCGGERRGPSALGKMLDGSGCIAGIEEEIIDIDRLDGQRIQTGTRLDGTQFETRNHRFEFHSGFLQRMAIGRSLRRKRTLFAKERYLLNGTVSPGSVAFRILSRKGLDSLVLIGSRDGENGVLKRAERNRTGRHRSDAGVHHNDYLHGFGNLLETLLPRLDLGIGPSIAYKIITGIHQVNRNVVVERHDRACTLRVLDRVDFRGTRQRHGEIGLAAGSRTVRLGILVTSCQHDQRGQEAKAFIHLFHSLFSKNPGKGIPPPG